MIYLYNVLRCTVLYYTAMPRPQSLSLVPPQFCFARCSTMAVLLLQFAWNLGLLASRLPPCLRCLKNLYNHGATHIDVRLLPTRRNDYGACWKPLCHTNLSNATTEYCYAPMQRLSRLRAKRCCLLALQVLLLFRQLKHCPCGQNNSSNNMTVLIYLLLRA